MKAIKKRITSMRNFQNRVRLLYVKNEAEKSAKDRLLGLMRLSMRGTAKNEILYQQIHPYMSISNKELLDSDLLERFGRDAQDFKKLRKSIWLPNRRHHEKRN